MNKTIFLTLFILSTSTQAQQMNIEVLRADDTFRRSNKNTIVVYLSGQIDKSATSRLKATLAKFPSPNNGYDFVLNSPGGLIYQGIELGRYIRSLPKSKTYIGQVHSQLKHNNLSASLRPATCASSCSLAFLGGHQRYVPNSSRYGVHQFYIDSLISQHDAISVGQITTADVVSYLNEMGIDSNLVSVMARTDKNDMNFLSQSQLLKFNIIQTQSPTGKYNATPPKNYGQSLSSFLSSPIRVHFAER